MPLPAEAGSERALRAMARLLRRFHDAVASFPSPYSRLPYGLGGVTPCDVVFVGGLPRRFARLPGLVPAPRVADVALTLVHWAPVREPVARPAVQRPLAAGPRLAGFCDAYGLGAQPRRAVLPVIREHLRESADASALAWLETHWDELDAYLR